MFIKRGNLTYHIPGHESRHECKPDAGAAFCFDYGVLDVKGNKYKTNKKEKNK
jgi:hypothetical protein